jgi:hypothetical protein
MLNCILGMVDKTKRALAILQQRTMDNAASVWTPARSAPAAATSRIIPNPVQNNSFSSHAPNHISPAAAAHHQQQSQHHSKSQQQSNTHSPPTVIKQMSRNDMITAGLHSQSLNESRHQQQQPVTADSSRSARAAVSNGRGESRACAVLSRNTFSLYF